MEHELHHVMIGLPEAGKTTYLAALWHLLCSDEVDGSLRLARLDGDQTYLNEIREAWASVTPIGRTNPGNEPNLSFLLSDVDNGEEIQIRVPDLSGEAFEADWIERSMGEERARLLEDISGAMLFVNPQNLKGEILISEVASVAAELSEDDEESVDDGEGEMLNWDAALAPTQVQLVDLLQILLRLNRKRPIYLVVVVSAWDQVHGSTTPSRWVERELPLLWQFLGSNTSQFETTFFGVSAQGGDLELKGDQLRGIEIPANRISVVDATRTASHDITLPLRWLMSKSAP